MNKLTVLAITLIAFTGMATAQSSQAIADAGTTPGNPFYFLDQLGDQAEIAIASVQGPNAKAKAHARVAEERIAEVQKLSEKNDTENLGKALALYQVQNERARQAIQNSTSEETANEVENRTRRSQDILEEVKIKVPEEALGGIQTAIENSQRSLDEIKQRRDEGKFKPKDAGKPNETGKPDSAGKPSELPN